MGRVDHQFYLAHVADANKDAANAACAAVSGNFANLFSVACRPEPGDTPTHWGVRVRLDPTQRSKLGVAVGGLGVVSRIENARGERQPDDFDIFLADSQLRRGDYVHVTGLFKGDGTDGAQTATTTPQVMNQWTSEHDMVNSTAVTPAGTPRIEVDYAGEYYFYLRLVFDDTSEQQFDFRAVKNTGFASGIFSATESPLTLQTSIAGFAASDKLGISVQVASGSESFKLLNGSWFGLKRIG